jgi:predicted secreted Zn-dependent protease
MRGRMLACLLACSPLIATAADPSPTIEYYPIAGVTAKALRAEMNRLGPFDDAGSRNDGKTNWDIQWRYDYDRDAGGCTATHIRVTLKVRMTLPRWTPPANAPRSLIDTWRKFDRALRIHEDGHHRLAIEAADEVRRVLQANRKHSDCKRLETRLNAAGHAVLDELRRRNARYDRETDSGRKQGTIVL